MTDRRLGRRDGQMNRFPRDPWCRVRRACSARPLPPLRCSAGAAAGRLRPRRGAGAARVRLLRRAALLPRCATRQARELGIPVDRGGAADSAAAPAAGAETGRTATPTNVQEAGVDEPDIVKTAGSTIFTVDGNVLRAVDTSGGVAGAERLARAPRGPANATGRRLPAAVAGDRLLAIGSRLRLRDPWIEARRDRPGRCLSRSATHRCSPRSTSPIRRRWRLSRTMAFDGSYVSARLTGSTVRLVSSDYPSGRSAERATAAPGAEDDDPRPVERRAAARQARRLRRRAADRRASAGTGMLSVLTIDLGAGLPAVDVDAVLTDGQIVYASPTALYVATERWRHRRPGSRARRCVTEIHRFDTSDPEATDVRRQRRGRTATC